MASEKQVLQTRNGVILEQVTLRDGSIAVSIASVVKRPLTPEVRNFGGVITAQQYFNEEVQRCTQAGIVNW